MVVAVTPLVIATTTGMPAVGSWLNSTCPRTVMVCAVADRPITVKNKKARLLLTAKRSEIGKWFMRFN